ncbi:MAG TPA: hypothetical protein PKW45_21000 [Bryobacteraceae bacterium]|nr:hypothetical protein [Bryobacteraceae bacterium]
MRFPQDCEPASDLYYIQHIGYCGNCLIWWREGGHGYTSNLDEAWKLPKTEAERICKDRPSKDIPWPVALVDACSVRHATQDGLAAAESVPVVPEPAPITHESLLKALKLLRDAVAAQVQKQSDVKHWGGVGGWWELVEYKEILDAAMFRIDRHHERTLRIWPPKQVEE